jgi:hypothetical protein
VVKHQAVAIQTVFAGRTRQVGINVAQLSYRKWQCISRDGSKATIALARMFLGVIQQPQKTAGCY